MQLFYLSVEVHQVYRSDEVQLFYQVSQCRSAIILRSVEVHLVYHSANNNGLYFLRQHKLAQTDIFLFNCNPRKYK